MKIINNIKVKRYVVALLLALTLSPLQAGGADSVFEEYQIKAALLFKLFSFVTWPESSEQSNPANFTICVLGENEFGGILDTIEGRSNDGSPISIRYYERSQSLLGNCHIAFISRSKRSSLNSILDNLNSSPILTVGDTDNFARNGGMIQFNTEKGRLGIEINLEAAKDENIKISAPLLQLATIVETARSTE